MTNFSPCLAMPGLVPHVMNWNHGIAGKYGTCEKCHRKFTLNMDEYFSPGNSGHSDTYPTFPIMQENGKLVGRVEIEKNFADLIGLGVCKLSTGVLTQEKRIVFFTVVPDHALSTSVSSPHPFPDSKTERPSCVTSLLQKPDMSDFDDPKARMEIHK